MIRWPAVSLCCAVFLLVLTLSHAQQEPVTGQGAEATYPASDEGLQKLLQDSIEAARSKETAKEAAMVRALIIPEDSAWFTDQFGPAFGPRLSVAYQRTKPVLEQEIRRVYEGNAQRGWLKPKIFRYEDAAVVDSPTDYYLNCMDKVEPLYRTAFDGNRIGYQVGPRPDNPKKFHIIAGDLPGYYVYSGGTFRFIPEEVLQLLPKERPIRIQLGMDVMRSKLANGSPPLDSMETMQMLMSQHRRVYGKVVIHFVLDTAGKIKEINVAEGSPELSESFLQAVKQWTFEPTTVDGDPVEVEVNLETGRQRNGKWE